MNKIILVLFLVAVLALSGCSREDSSEKPIGGEKDEHGCLVAAGYQWCPSTQKCQRMWEEYCEEYTEQHRDNEKASAETPQDVSQQDASDNTEDRAEQTEENLCVLECNAGTAWCQDETFYACIEQDGCLKITEINPCGDDYSCETMMWCTSSTSNVKKGILPLNQLTSLTSVKGDIGEEFSLNTDTYSGLRCSILKVTKGQAVFECS